MRTLDVDAVLHKVRENFLRLLTERTLVVEAVLAKRSLESRDLEQVLFVVHKVAGTASTLGFSHLGEAARACEESLRGDQASDGVLSPRNKQLLAGFVCQSYQMLEISE